MFWVFLRLGRGGLCGCGRRCRLRRLLCSRRFHRTWRSLGFRRGLLGVRSRLARSGLSLHALGHRSLVALREPHDEREPSAAPLVPVRSLERPHRVAAAHDGVRGVRAALDLFFRRARREQRHEVVEDPPCVDVARRGELERDFIEERHAARARADRHPRHDVLLAGVCDRSEPRAPTRRAEPFADRGLLALRRDEHVGLAVVAGAVEHGEVAPVRAAVLTLFRGASWHRALARHHPQTALADHLSARVAHAGLPREARAVPLGQREPAALRVARADPAARVGQRSARGEVSRVGVLRALARLPQEP